MISLCQKEKKDKLKSTQEQNRPIKNKNKINSHKTNKKNKQAKEKKEKMHKYIKIK